MQRTSAAQNYPFEPCYHSGYAFAFDCAVNFQIAHDSFEHVDVCKLDCRRWLPALFVGRTG